MGTEASACASISALLCLLFCSTINYNYNSSLKWVKTCSSELQTRKLNWTTWLTTFICHNRHTIKPKYNPKWQAVRKAAYRAGDDLINMYRCNVSMKKYDNEKQELNSIHRRRDKGQGQGGMDPPIIWLGATMHLAPPILGTWISYFSPKLKSAKKIVFSVYLHCILYIGFWGPISKVPKKIFLSFS